MMCTADVLGRVCFENTVSNDGDEEVSADWPDTTGTDEDISHHTTRL